jgi:NAD+ synthase
MGLSDSISVWIAGVVETAEADGVLLGISGGLDSAVCAALCRNALGERSLGVIMPCHSNPVDYEDALLVSRTFELRTVTVDLGGVYDEFIRVLPEGSRKASGNLMPRLRMATLYYFACQMGYLVVGTSNKSELSVGYFTKYGDGGADLLPVGGIYKSDLAELADELGVPPRILSKVPCAGLWEGQTDEGEMGISYEVLDHALKALERGESNQLEPGVAEKVGGMVRTSAHKRRLPPVFDPGGDAF